MKLLNKTNRLSIKSFVVGFDKMNKTKAERKNG